MKIRAVVRATGGRLLAGSAGFEIDPARISTDTRTLRAGDVFLAISGERFDGNDFAAEAYGKGASGAIVSRDIPVPARAFAIRVEDTAKAFRDIAASHRASFRIPIIAVTGSNGKTTVKEMIAAVLSQTYTVLRNDGTKNNHIGVPQTLLKLTARHDLCVLELGTNRPGEIALLGRIVRPTAAVITNIGPAHLEFLGDLEGVYREKRSILRSFDRRSKAVAIVNGDDPFLSRIRKGGYDLVTFGLGERNAVRGRVTGRERSRVRFTVNGSMDFETGLLGDHNVSNALAAVAAGLRFGVPAGTIAKALAAFRPAAMRMDVSEVGGVHVINDAYNSNPLSMERALGVVRDFPAPAKWVVSGDMLELGSRSVDLHRAVGATAARSNLSGLLTYGEFSRYTHAAAREGGMRAQALWHCSTHGQIADILRRVVRPGDLVLVKGSRGMRMEEVLGKMKERG